MAIAPISDGEEAALAFQKINAAIGKVNNVDSRLLEVEDVVGSTVVKRTISTEPPLTIPVDGEEWVVV